VKGLVSRYTTYSDIPRNLPLGVVECFSHRWDGLYKRVRDIGAGTVEEHFRALGDGVGGVGCVAGLACSVFHAGQETRDMYFYPAARLDGLLRRWTQGQKKVKEWYSADAPGSLAYRGVKFAVSSPTAGGTRRGGGITAGSGRESNQGGGLASPGRGSSSPQGENFSRKGLRGASSNGVGFSNPCFWVLLGKKELEVAKMSEKYRQSHNEAAAGDLAPPAGSVFSRSAMSKIKFAVTLGEITVTYASPPGRLTKTVHRFQKSTGNVFLINHVDPVVMSRLGGPGVILEKGVHPSDFDSDALLQQLSLKERQCAAAARSSSRAFEEVLEAMQTEASQVLLQRNVFDIAQERWLAGSSVGGGSEEKRDKGWFAC